MLRAFHNQNSRLRNIAFVDNEITAAQLIPAIWLDLNEADDSEKAIVESISRTDLPEADDMAELEASSRFFEDEEGIHVHTLFLSLSEGRYQTGTVAFTLQTNRLISTREMHFPVFRLIRMRCRGGRIMEQSPISLLLTLFDFKIEHMADIIEDLYVDLNGVSHQVLESDNSDFEHAIDELADVEDTSGKVRLCLMDTQRAVNFLSKHFRHHDEVRELCSELQQDIDSLLQHTNFVFEKVNFLMDAAQGFINIEQNQIIKTFSIASVVFLPPTLVASLYGMNFQFMPELALQYGYPMAVCMMILAGLLPLWYFKRKGWL